MPDRPNKEPFSGGHNLVCDAREFGDTPLSLDPTDDPQVMSLARAAKGGDSEAFAALITALHLPLRRFLAARAISSDQVEELLQDTFVAAWQGLPQWRGDGSPRSWVVGIAANLLRADVRRRMKTQGVGPDLMEALLLKAYDMHLGVADAAHERYRLQVLRASITHLGTGFAQRQFSQFPFQRLTNCDLRTVAT